MNTLKISLLALVALLLLVLLIDRSRISSQLQRVDEVEQQQLSALQELEEKLNHGVVVSAQPNEAGKSSAGPASAAGSASGAKGNANDTTTDADYRLPPTPPASRTAIPSLG